MKANTHRHLVSSFIVSSSFNRYRLIQSLTIEGRQAYFLRDYTRLKIIGERLVQLSPRSEYIGRWFLLMANRVLWTQYPKELTVELESLAEDSPLPVRAVAMSSLAGISINQGDSTKGTVSLILESSALSLRCGDLPNFIQTQNQLSFLSSINGNHHESLEILRGLEPAVNKVGSLHSYLKTDFYNSVAHELAQLGKHAEAKVFASLVAFSPCLPVYPEWQSNISEILLKKTDMANTKPTPKPLGKLIQFPSKPAATEDWIILANKGSELFEIGDWPIDELKELREIMVAKKKRQLQNAKP
jgi:hypothetical protein